MNLSHDTLRDLTAFTEFKSEGGILRRHFVLCKEHVMKGRLVSAPSLDGFRMTLQLRRIIGGISEKEHAATLTARSPRYLTTATAWKLRETLQRLLLDHHPFGLLPRGNVLPPSQGLELAASQSIEASGQGSGLRQTPWAATSSTVGPKLPVRWPTPYILL